MPYATLSPSSPAFYYELEANLLPKTTVFLHGNLASGRWYQPTRELCLRAAPRAGHKGSFITLDFWGCGQSDPPRAPEQMHPRELASSCLALLRAVGLQQVCLVGHSTGALVAALMLAQAPDQFERAVLLDPVGARGIDFTEAMRPIFERMKTDRELTAQVMAGTVYGMDPSWPFFRHAIVDDAQRAVRTVGIAVLEALEGLDTRAELATIPHPVLVAHGEHDTLLSRSDSEQLAGLIKNGEFRTIPNHGHCLNLEDPVAFLELVSTFLNR